MGADTEPVAAPVLVAAPAVRRRGSEAASGPEPEVAQVTDVARRRRRRRAGADAEVVPEPSPTVPPPTPPIVGPAPFWWVVAAAGVTAAWVAITLAGGDLPGVDTTARGAAAAAAVAAVTAAGGRGSTTRSASVSLVLLVALPLGVAVAEGGSAVFLSALLIAAAAGEVASASPRGRPERRRRLLTALALAAAASGVAAGVYLARGDTTSWPLPSADVGAAALGAAAAVFLVLVAIYGPPRTRPWVVPGLLLGVTAATAHPEPWVAVAGAAAAALWSCRFPHVPAPALAALAVAAATVPEAGPASALLAAAAALAAAVPHPAAALLALPGAASVASAVVTGSPDWSLVAIAAGTAALALALSRGIHIHPGMTRSPGVGLHLMPAGLLGAWLVLSPGSWGWTGAGTIGSYDRGALVAMAAALIVLLITRVRALTPRRSA